MSRRPPPHGRNTDETVAARLRKETGESWKTVKRWIARGKVFVDGEVVIDPGFRPSAEQAIQVRQNAKTPERSPFSVRIVFQDAHLVVIDKPSGVSSVPYHNHERDTAMDLIRAAWRARGEAASGPLFVVHRIDKDTSGLLMFARSKRGELGLARQLREHTMHRRYTCVANGRVRPGRMESYLVRNRGDGLRGSNRHDQKGKRAITHVEVIRELSRATVCAVRLETGRTHQIRIHLSEAGHPLVGERVYSRDWELAQKPLLPSTRLLLHAQTLGFQHPINGQQMHFEAPLPVDFTDNLTRIEVG